jgi:hypothetical protein
VGAFADLRWKTGSLLASAHWESLRYADTLNRMPLEPYCLLNLTLNQELGRSVAVFALARNVLNWLYTSFAEYPMPGFTISCGARFTFAPKKENRKQGTGNSVASAAVSPFSEKPLSLNYDPTVCRMLFDTV